MFEVFDSVKSLASRCKNNS